MGHYKSNLRDLEFNLFEVLDRQDVLGTGPYEDVDVDTARDMLREVGRLAENELADSLLDSDLHPPVFDPADGSVTLPESFKKSYAAYMDGGWGLLDIPGELGGTVIPPSLRWAIAELVLGSNPAVHMYSAGMAFAKVLYYLGTPEQKKLAALVADHQWGATMVLTEPDAGTDVGAGRTRAVQQDDGTWHITGVKRFITSGEHDLTDNIVHFVLARPEGAGPGFAATVEALGNAEQRHWAQIMVDREWGATMVLTEPDAGSDVGAGTTKAFPQADGSWHIEGVKRFITSGEHDLSLIHI